MSEVNEFVPVVMQSSGKKDHQIAGLVFNQESFDELFRLIFQHERAVVIKAIHAVETVLETKPYLLEAHKPQLLSLLRSGDHKELKGHLPYLLSLLIFTTEEMEEVWHVLTFWVKNPNETKRVRVNALQALHDLRSQAPGYEDDYRDTLLFAAKDAALQTRAGKLNDN
jgi:hypothetical protein